MEEDLYFSFSAGGDGGGWSKVLNRYFSFSAGGDGGGGSKVLNNSHSHLEEMEEDGIRS